MQEIEMYNWTAGSLDIDASQSGTWEVEQYPILLHAATATPMLVNPSLIEYCQGELDKDRNLYGVRIHFASGNTLFLPADQGLKFLETIEKSRVTILKHETTKRSLVDKFKEKRNS